MLLTIFSNPKQYIKVQNALKTRIKLDENLYFQIIIHTKDPDKPILTGTIFDLNDRTTLVFDTYNLKLAIDCAKNIDEQFETYKITNEDFRKIFDRSNQVVECEYIYKSVERKSTAFDLKGLEPFIKRLEESIIVSLTLSLKDFNVLITAREEGRISISPDVDASKMVEIMKSLLGNDIRSIVT